MDPIQHALAKAKVEAISELMDAGYLWADPCYFVGMLLDHATTTPEGCRVLDEIFQVFEYNREAGVGEAKLPGGIPIRGLID